MRRIAPGDRLPAMETRLVGGGRWTLADDKPEQLALLAFYRGVFCPVCRVWLAELDRLAPEFEKRGVPVIALSCDAKESAEKTVADGRFKRLRVGYKLDPEEARKAGLYISEGRGLNPVTRKKEPRLFTEPGVLLAQPDGTLYASWIQSLPYARPHVAEILTAVDNILERGVLAPRGAD